MDDNTTCNKEGVWGYDFALCRKLERARLRTMPDVPVLKVYDVMEGKGVYPSLLLEIMEALGCKCDREGDGLILRTIEKDMT